jgi:hypothetical protein
MDCVSELLSRSANQGTARQVIVFDWYDGPREGVLALADPECAFVFELLAEKSNPDDLDDRLFTLSEIPAVAFEHVLSALAPLGTPSSPIYVPIWKFPNTEQQRKAERAVDSVLASRRPPALVVHSRDMLRFLGRRRLDASPDEKRDWFSHFGLTSHG